MPRNAIIDFVSYMEDLCRRHKEIMHGKNGHIHFVDSGAQKNRQQKKQREEKQGKRLTVRISCLLLSSIAGQVKCRFGHIKAGVPFPNRYPF
ncbi:hypothetical protein EZS27_025813 [termite gut metagenome]|uniref:Uncharacterized protein n=1 Tax=termite gut metagenome TaxID=433724 RepID=A0A5J4QTS5_9ZZZZ